MSEEHPLAQMKELNPHVLNDSVVFAVKQVDEDGAKEGVRKQCRKIGFSPKSVELVDNVHTMMHMIRSKRGICICGKFEYGNSAGLRFYPVSDLLGPTYIVAVWHPDKMTKPLKNLIKILSSDR